MMNRIFSGEGWAAPALATMRYMADGTRERNEGEVARLPDHWAAYGLEELNKADLLDEQLSEYALRLAGYFSLRLRVEQQRTGAAWNVAVRGFPGPPSGVGTAGEGLAALYRLSETDHRLGDVRGDMAERLTCTAGLMASRQVSASDASGDVRPLHSTGAWFYKNYTQVDDQQHVLSALLGAESAFGEDE